MVSLQPHLNTFLKSLPPSPVDQTKLHELVARTISEVKDKSTPENRKSQWEYLLKNDIFLLAATEGTALKHDESKYYDALRDKLDLALAFTEQDACEQTFPFTVLQDLLETQTIASCSHIFSWIEARATRLTEGMVPQKGKALILLRTLNDLLRRLSKTGTTTIFCGRILTFLSGVFPLGERSGVNLRGEYGPTWEGVQFAPKTKKDNDRDMKIDEPSAPESKEEPSGDDKMQVDATKPLTPQEKKEEFYNTFWSLQLYFSKPPIFANKGSFTDFREAVNKVMPIIKEATAKERAMMGSRGGANAGILKRKREPDEETNFTEYFFAKFLTSPDLLDLEVADTHFRRQFLFQLLILLNHLSNFTKAAKGAWTTARNRSLQMEFTLEDSEAQWVQESTTKVVEELRQTTPNGRIFADTACAILEREKNWVKWKNELCTPFDKEPWSEEVDGQKVGLVESTRHIRENLRQPPPEWKWALGTESLTEIWEMGYSSLRDLRDPVQPGDVKDFVKKIKQEDARINMKRQKLERMARARSANATSNPPAIVVSSDSASTSKPPETSGPRPEANSSGLAAPRPVLAAGSSPLHPSLPPKPGTPSKPASSSQEPLKNSTPIPNVAPAASPVPASTPIPPHALVDPEIAKYEENKQRWAWLALRTARDQYLQHFGKIGTGDVEALAQEIEKEKEKRLKGEDGTGAAATDEQGSRSPASTQIVDGAESLQKDGDGDVKMDA
ncbi:hypothetical protein NLJ89_g3610 [Agrocybe chaxingu]|uniref:THO complex subunit 1 n=1 Tax=Agrocybe chaxingu TaxID=84603 RepID=A0A9W8K3N5_9AGAR|nr:hypothetical protein NLJ89_g3610 [Agrocybe chaxingu]